MKTYPLPLFAPVEDLRPFILWEFSTDIRAARPTIYATFIDLN